MKTLLAALLFSTIAFASQANELTVEQKKKFANFYRDQVDLLEIHPDRPEVKAIFVDLDGDGLEEAIATSYEAFYETGWLWSVYKKEGDKWKPIQGYDPEAKAIRPGSGIYARPGEIFKVVHNDGTRQFLTLNLHFDKFARDGIGPINKTSFWIDDKGIFQEQKVEDLERYLAYQGAHRIGLVQRLDALPVEVFPADAAKE